MSTLKQKFGDFRNDASYGFLMLIHGIKKDAANKIFFL